MKTFLKLLLVAIVINASVRGAMAGARYYKFKDAAQHAVLFGNESTPEEIQQLILERGRELNVPISPDDVVVNRKGTRTWADASYRQTIEVFPNQLYPVDWSFMVEGYSMVIGPPPARK